MDLLLSDIEDFLVLFTCILGQGGYVHITSILSTFGGSLALDVRDDSMVGTLHPLMIV
jgi:hypothetical protein